MPLSFDHFASSDFNVWLRSWFMGHGIPSEDVHPDPKKISAVTKMKAQHQKTWHSCVDLSQEGWGWGLTRTQIHYVCSPKGPKKNCWYIGGGERGRRRGIGGGGGGGGVLPMTKLTQKSCLSQFFVCGALSSCEAERQKYYRRQNWDCLTRAVSQAENFKLKLDRSICIRGSIRRSLE